MLNAATLDATSFVPETFRTGTVTFLELVSIGKNKIPDYVNTWKERTRQIDNELSLIENNSSGCVEWWKGDARFGNQSYQFSSGRFAVRQHRTFYADRLPPQEQVRYEKLQREKWQIETTIQNLLTAMRLAR